MVSLICNQYQPADARVKSMRCEEKIFCDPDRNQRREPRVVERREERGAARLPIQLNDDRLLSQRIDDADRPIVVDEENSGRDAETIRIRNGLLGWRKLNRQYRAVQDWCAQYLDRNRWRGFHQR